MSAAVAFTPTHTKPTEQFYQEPKADKQEDTCHGEIGLCARHHSRFDSEHEWEGLCDNFNITRFFTLSGKGCRKN